MATSAPSSLSQSGHAGWRANVARPTKGKSIRSGVLRLVLSVVIAISFPPTAETVLRWPDWSIVQQFSSVWLAMGSHSERSQRRGHCESWALHLTRRPCDAADPYEHRQGSFQDRIYSATPLGRGSPALATGRFAASCI